MKLLCLLGLHKMKFVDPVCHKDALWAVIGRRYYQRCSRCKRRTETFTLTREMLP